MEVRVDACEPSLARSWHLPNKDVAITALCEGLNATVLDSDDEFDSAYTLGNELGRGGMACVYTAKSRRSPAPRPMELAVKVIDKERLTGIAPTADRLAARLRDECRVLAELHHPHVIQLLEICESPSCLYIVMERADGGALLEKIVEVGWFTEAAALHVMRQLVEVLAFMHSHGVIHRDIKPENLLVISPHGDSWDIKVSDFGVVKIFSDQETLATSMSRMPSRLPSFHLPTSHAGSAIFGSSAPFGSHAMLAAEGTIGTASKVAPYTEGGGSKVATALARCDTNLGTPFYRAPEQVFCHPPYPTTYGPGVDVWAAGVVMYILLAGTFPFEDDSIPPPPIEPIGMPPQIQPTAAGAHWRLRRSSPPVGRPWAWNLKEDDDEQEQEDEEGDSGDGHVDAAGGRRSAGRFYSFPHAQWATVSRAAKAAIDAMLTVDPRQRPTAREMLRHPWLLRQHQPTRPPSFITADHEVATPTAAAAAVTAAAEEAEEAAAAAAEEEEEAEAVQLEEASPQDEQSLASSYIDSVRSLVQATKRAREARASVGGSANNSAAWTPESSVAASRAGSPHGSVCRRPPRKIGRTGGGGAGADGGSNHGADRAGGRLHQPVVSSVAWPASAGPERSSAPQSPAVTAAVGTDAGWSELQMALAEALQQSTGFVVGDRLGAIKEPR